MINGINHITLSVNNIERTFWFYKDILNLKPIMKSQTSCYFLAGNTWIAFVLENDNQERRLYSHIALNCEKAEMDIFKKRMEENGIRKWQENETEGESIYFLDPSGNKLELHCTSLADRIGDGKKNWGTKVEWFL